MKARMLEKQALKQALKQAYHERENLEAGDKWKVHVMHRIRHMGPLESGPNFFELFEQVVWRLAPATSLLVVALALLLIVSGYTQENELVTLLLSEPEELTLAQLLGIGV